MAALLKLIKNDKGATAIEYALIAALIALASIYGMKGLGTRLLGMYTNIATAVSV
jgi:pilus assembly protein Flp/PilA